MFGRYARDDADRVALIAAYREYQLAHHDRLIRCYDGVLDTARALQRARARARPSSRASPEALAMRGLAHVGLARYMDTIVGCDSSARHKPDPEPVRLALHRLGCSPEDAMFVGDSVHDVMAGNAAGVATVAALWGAVRAEHESRAWRSNRDVSGRTAVSEFIGLLDSSPRVRAVLRCAFHNRPVRDSNLPPPWTVQFSARMETSTRMAAVAIIEASVEPQSAAT